ncbi:FKBP-type peptidyl-prolyl cis-trans isomerase [Flavobacterium capsici]|uniref:FKBP-type peptidylprolyl isomerase n=1 Tax=Flavobacterium capsici TaxID=3075618 RepID=A0AA96EUI7_9FLAO|nr:MULTISPECIES: FKBP-type peptidylprolyl isomerase [unclassified Flavobacterium]WNM18783.1 FKBP-type peptidylprolyl isomerase [Flavobacterium sp. PMR2A8]WNM22834.1 FKBP-type peptidylprolyl isomerase [Flavobacterium sp. PMTSA4]
MNKFLKTFSMLAIIVIIASCSKSDSSNEVPLRDYAEQYATDIANIEEFMQTHYMEVVNNPGADDDMDVTFTKIPDGGTQVSIWNQTDYPIQTRLVEQNDITYKIYYLQLREGSGPESKSPCNVDQVLAGYRGEYLYKSTVDGVTELKGIQFEENKNPQSFLSLTGVIRGWAEIFPKFKTGVYTENPDGTVSYSDFGAGVMFIPSGLAYYRSSQGTIPSYSPLVFSFKLYEINRADQDGDGIPSYLEDINNDGYMYVFDADVTNPDDTDGDGVPDFLDTDDDGDQFLTRYEIRINVEETAIYSFDDIPTCGSNGNGKKRHLDPSCHN